MSLRLKILSFVTIACLFCTAAAIWVARVNLEGKMHDDLREKSEAILTRLESARRYVASQGLLDETIKDVVKRFPHGQLPDEVKQKILNVVPIYASLKIGQDEAKKDQYQFRVAAQEARRKENEADPQEVEFLARFEEDPSLKQLFYEDKEGEAIWVMRPVRLSKNDGCLDCHGHPSTSPFGNGKDVLGFQMENWADGKLHGMFKIISSTKPVKEAVVHATMNIIFWAGGILIVALAAVIYLLRLPINTLANITKSIKQTAENSLTSSQELGDAAQTVSASTTEQAAGVQETMASMSEMSSMIAKTLDLAKQTQDLTSELDSKSQNGTQVMQGMVSSMESIKQSNEELKKMVQIINDISTKTNVINDIVFKTQLLSVNASIEAARAGQHGKGFAVVAEEVGNLAQISGKAAEEIRDMLSKSQTHVQEVVNVTNGRVAEGERVSQDAMKSFVEISEGIKKIQSYSQSVNEATNQQQEGITQISVAMNQMDQASQQNSQMASNVSGLSDSMVAQSEELLNLSAETETLVYGRTQPPEAANPSVRKSEPVKKAKTKPSVQAATKPRSKLNLIGLKDKIKEKVKTQDAGGPIKNGHDLHADSEDFKDVV